MRSSSIALLTVFVLLTSACSSSSTTVTASSPSTTAASPSSVAASTVPATTAALHEPPSSTVAAAPSPELIDIANFVTASGLVPALTQPADCLGAAGVCLFQPVESLTDRLRPEDQRYGQPSAEYRTWGQSGWTLNTRSDETGAITRVRVDIDGATVVAASGGALIGVTTIGEMRESSHATECYSGFEGQVFFFYTYPGGAEGSTIVSFGNSFSVGEPGTPERFGPELDAMPIRIFEASTTGSACEPSPP